MLFFAYSPCIFVHKKNVIGIINKHDHFIVESEIFFIVIGPALHNRTSEQMDQNTGR